MKLAIYILTLCLIGCHKKTASHESFSSENTHDQVAHNEYPAKIYTLLELFKTIKPDTDPQMFYDQMEDAGIVLKDKDFLYGSGDLGQSEEAHDLGIEGQYILELEYASLEPRGIWKAQIIKHSVSHFKNADFKNAWDGSVIVYPYFYKGRIITKEETPKIENPAETLHIEKP